MKKYMYIIKKNKYCLILALFILSFYLGRGVCALAKNTGKNTNSTVIVIDPGHGGSDPGKISTSGVMEKDVNLSIAMALKQLFENRGFTVVMTRTTDCDLAPDNSKHPKTDDLTKRTALMSKSNVAVSISIHQNSFEDNSSCGPQVFYYEASDAGISDGEQRVRIDVALEHDISAKESKMSDMKSNTESDNETKKQLDGGESVQTTRLYHIAEQFIVNVQRVIAQDSL